MMNKEQFESLTAYKAGYKMATVNEKLLKRLQVDNLKISLCQGNQVDEDNNKIDCATALKPRCYNKRRCDTCRRIDDGFPDILTFAKSKSDIIADKQNPLKMLFGVTKEKFEKDVDDLLRQ